MSLNDSINNLFEHGVTAATFAVTPQGTKHLTVEQEFQTQEGVSKCRHQVAGSSWVDVVSKIQQTVEYCSNLKASIIKLN